MRISIITSQSGLKDGQQQLLKQVLLDKKCSELIFDGSQHLPYEIAQDCGVKQFRVFPSIFPSRRAIEPTLFNQWIADVPTDTNWYFEDFDKPLIQALKMVNAGEILVACPKEFKYSYRSFTWKVIKYGWKVRKGLVIIIPPVESLDE